jgi:hypothetical protein
VPTGGTVGQVLRKIDSTNYNTVWAKDEVIISDEVLTAAQSQFTPIALAGFQTIEFNLMARPNPAVGGDVTVYWQGSFDGGVTWVSAAASYNEQIVYGQLGAMTVANANATAGRVLPSMARTLASPGQAKGNFDKGATGLRAEMLSLWTSLWTSGRANGSSGTTLLTTGALTHIKFLVDVANGLNVGSSLTLKGIPR